MAKRMTLDSGSGERYWRGPASNSSNGERIFQQVVEDRDGI